MGRLQIPLYVSGPAADGCPDLMEGTPEHPPFGTQFFNVTGECFEYHTVTCKLRQFRQGCGHFAGFMVEWVPVKL